MDILLAVLWGMTPGLLTGGAMMVLSWRGRLRRTVQPLPMPPPYPMPQRKSEQVEPLAGMGYLWTAQQIADSIDEQEVTYGS